MSQKIEISRRACIIVGLRVFGRKTIIKNVMEPAAMFLKANNLSSVMIISQDKKRQNDSYIQQNLCTIVRAMCFFDESSTLLHLCEHLQFSIFCNRKFPPTL